MNELDLIFLMAFLFIGSLALLMALLIAKDVLDSRRDKDEE